MGKINKGDYIMKTLRLLFVMFALSVLAGCGTIAYGYGYEYSYGHGHLEYNHYYEDLYGYPRARVPHGHYHGSTYCVVNHGVYNRYDHRYRPRHHRRCYLTRVEVWNSRLQRHVFVSRRVCR